MAQDAALLTGELTLTPPARRHGEWHIADPEGTAGHVIPPGRGAGHVRLHGLGFDIAFGQLDDGGRTILRPWRLTIEGANLFHAWSMPGEGWLNRLLARDHPMYTLYDHRPPLRMMLRGGLNRQIALLAGDDLLALAEYPRSRGPRHIRHAPTLPPAVQAALCHAVTQPR